MLNREAVALWEVLTEIQRGEEIRPTKSPVKFNYALARNMTRLRPLMIEAQTRAKAPKEILLPFDEARIELCRQFAELDEHNQPKIDGNDFVIREADKATFKGQMEDLESTFAETISKADQARVDFEAWMDSEANFEAFTIKFSYLPENTLTPRQLEILDFIIAEG